MKLWSRLLGASENTECLSLPLQDPVKKVDMSLSQDTDENTPVSLLGLKRCRSLSETLTATLQLSLWWIATFSVRTFCRANEPRRTR